MTNQDLNDQESRSSTEIESDIRQTRGRMDATLDELGDRLTRALIELGSRLVGISRRWLSPCRSDKRYLPKLRSVCERKSDPIPAGRSWSCLDDH